MPKKIISPITRINGFWRIDVNIENHRVVDAYSSGIFLGELKRFFKEEIREMQYISLRICGICSTAHSLASSLALEDAFKVKPPRSGIIIRNLIFGADLLQTIFDIFIF